jgi:thymidylate kinase
MCHLRVHRDGMDSDTPRSVPAVVAAADSPTARAIRVLVEGLDLTGKTTLVQALVDVLTIRGVSARANRWMLAGRHPLSGPLRRLPRVRQPASGLITAALLGSGYLLDGALVRAQPPADTAVLVQDGYADRTVAFGMAGGPYLASCLALRWARLLAAFDIAVYLHAPVKVRAERLAARPNADTGDIRTVEDTAFAEAFTAMLVHGMGRRHRRLLVFDTSRHTRSKWPQPSLTPSPQLLKRSRTRVQPDAPAAPLGRCGRHETPHCDQPGPSRGRNHRPERRLGGAPAC